MPNFMEWGQSAEGHAGDAIDKNTAPYADFRSTEMEKMAKANYLRSGRFYEVYIDSELFPITPGKIKTKINGRNEVLELASGGQISILNDPGLTEWTFDVRLPNQEYPFAQYQEGYKPAKYFLDVLERLKQELVIFPFVVLRNFGSGHDTVVERATLEDYEILEDAEEAVDIMRVSLTLLKYNPIKTEKVNLITDEKTGGVVAEPEESRPDDRADAKVTDVPASHTVVAGDTLYMIAARTLGDGERYRELAEINGISNPNLIYPGQVIKFG